MKSISNIGKKRGRGRPATDATPVLVRLQPAQLAGLDAWIAKHDLEPTRPEAIRALIAAELKTPHHFKLPVKTEKHTQDEKIGKRAK